MALPIWGGSVPARHRSRDQSRGLSFFRRLSLKRAGSWLLVGTMVLSLPGCKLDQEEAMRAEVLDWVRLGETFYFYSQRSCTAALFDVKASRISSFVTKVRSVETALRALGETDPIAFQFDGLSPTVVTEQLMEADLPLGLSVLSAGTRGKDCMAAEMENAYFNALLDPTSVMIYAPGNKVSAIFDRRNSRIFVTRGRV